jgi:hypothetical protein
LNRSDFRCANVMNEMGRGIIVGYARVSADGQTLDAHQAALAAAGAERVFAARLPVRRRPANLLAKDTRRFERVLPTLFAEKVVPLFRRGDHDIAGGVALRADSP